MSGFTKQSVGLSYLRDTHHTYHSTQAWFLTAQGFGSKRIWHLTHSTIQGKIEYRTGVMLQPDLSNTNDTLMMYLQLSMLITNHVV